MTSVQNVWGLLLVLLVFIGDTGALVRPRKPLAHCALCRHCLKQGLQDQSIAPPSTKKVPEICFLKPANLLPTFRQNHLQTFQWNVRKSFLAFSECFTVLNMCSHEKYPIPLYNRSWCFIKWSSDNSELSFTVPRPLSVTFLCCDSQPSWLG